MGANTHIEWCDHTFNSWEGCTKVSPGCANCYAEHRNARFGGGTAPNWGKGAPRRRTSASNWAQPVKWNKEAEAAWENARGKGLPLNEPRRPRVFCASLADWLDDEVPVEWLADLMHLIWATPHLDWLLLTKRPENFERRMRAAYEAQPGATGHSLMMARWTNGIQSHPPANVWIGTTVEDQTRADERIPALLSIPARVRFLSCEPLLGPVDLTAVKQTVSPGFFGDCLQWYHRGKSHEDAGIDFPTVHWVICGGESGHGARPMHPDWARSLRDQCAAASVAFLFKQWGEWCQARVMTEEEESSGPARQGYVFVQNNGEIITSEKLGKKQTGRLLDGVEHNEFPEGSR